MGNLDADLVKRVILKEIYLSFLKSGFSEFRLAKTVGMKKSTVSRMFRFRTECFSNDEVIDFYKKCENVFELTKMDDLFSDLNNSNHLRAA